MDRRGATWFACWVLVFALTYLASRPISGLILLCSQRFGSVGLRSESTRAMVSKGLNKDAASAALLKGLQDGDKKVRYQAAVQLDHEGMASPEVIAALIGALKDSDQSVRGVACYSLGRIGPPAKEAVPQIIEVLKSEIEAGYIDQNHVVSMAATALGKMGSASEGAIPVLAGILDNLSGSSYLRRNVVMALGEIGPAAVPILVKAARHEDWGVRYDVARVFRAKGYPGEGVIEALTSLSHEDTWQTRINATVALAKLAPRTPGMLPALKVIAGQLEQAVQSGVPANKETDEMDLREVREIIEKAPNLAKPDAATAGPDIQVNVPKTSLTPAVPKADGTEADRVAPDKADIQWVRIPEGTFSMGSGNGSEGPAHSVTIKSFQISKTLVTNKQYKACVAAGACSPATYYGSQYEEDDQPIVGVDWNQANTFSQWVGGRLPSEAEWEYAARSAGKDQKYPWGNEEATCSLAVISGCSRATISVCSKPAGNTQQGLCDMAGNAWEWVQDWYHDSYNGAPIDGSAWERPAGSVRVNRGGTWNGHAGPARSAYRNYGNPDGRLYSLGFRPARSLPDSAASIPD